MTHGKVHGLPVSTFLHSLHMAKASQTQLNSQGWPFLLKAPHWLPRELPSCLLFHPTSSHRCWKSLEGNRCNQRIKSVKNIKENSFFARDSVSVELLFNLFSDIDV